MTSLSRILELCGLQQLDESAKDRYQSMFSFFDEPDGGPQPLRVWRDAASNEIDWARRILKRNDRVVWYLRLARISLLQNAVERLSSDPSSAQRVERMRRLLTRFEGELAKNSGRPATAISTACRQIRQGRGFKDQIAHFMSMDSQIPEIGKLAFSFQLPSEILTSLKEAEDDYADTIGNSNKVLKPTETSYTDAHKILDFGDGFAWWNLNVASCDAEADAMGHCGNTANPKRGDRILSLRKRSQVGDEVVEVPYLTFILDKEGLLGEMKGRGNAKPAKRYHKYITALLLNPIVTGIKGGGYKPENNFSLKDLPEADQEKILAQKPELKLKELNFSEKVGVLEGVGVKIESAEIIGDEVRVWQGRLTDLNNDFATALEKVRDGRQEVEETVISFGNVLEMIYDLNDGEIAKLAEIGNVPVPPQFTTAAVEQIAREFYNSPEVMDFITTAFRGSFATIAEDELNEFGKQTLYRVVALESSENVYPELHEPDDIFTGWFEVRISLDSFESMVEEAREGNGDSETADYIYFTGEDGFFSSDDYGMRELERDPTGFFRHDSPEVYELYKRVFPLVHSAMEDSSVSWSDTDELGEIVAAALNSRRFHHYRPGPDEMGDLFDQS